MAQQPDAQPAQQTNYSMKLFLAIVMVLVVAGHTDSTGLGGPFDLFPSYSYHVASFVFISGYFYNSKYEATPALYVRKRTSRLLLPMLGINAVYGLVIMAAQGLFGITYGEPISLETLLVSPFVSGHQFAFNLASWFVAPLWMSQIVNVFVRKGMRAAGLSERVVEFATFALYMVLGIVAVQMCRPDGPGSPNALVLSRLAFFLSCLGMGRFYRSVLEEHDNLRSLAYFGILFAVQLVIVYIARGDLSYAVAWGTYPQGALLTYLSTFTGIAFLLRISKLLGPVLGRTRGVLAVADNTFSIMCHHMLGVFLVNCVYYLAHQCLGVFPLFDVALFQESVWYLFFPAGCIQFAVVYLAAGIVVPLGIHACWVRIREGVSGLVRRGSAE